MFLTITKPKKALNKAFFKQNLKRSEINLLKDGLTKLSARFNETESEEHLKNIISDFLKETWYNGRFEINTNGRIDLAIHNGKTSKDPVGVILEVKKPTSPERITADNLNCKALHELILYYFDERNEKKNIQVKHLIATNIYEWFIFDENEFDKLFYRNTALQKLYKAKTEQCKDNPFFYSEAQKIIAGMQDEITCTLVDLRSYLPDSSKNYIKDDLLIELHKIFSPEHLLKLPFQNDSNSLNKEFYNELLHIIGLEEVKDGSKKLISRKRNPDDGSLLENTMNLLRVEGCLENLKDVDQYGATEEEQLFSVALELCINWLNRVLFLKLLEGQLISYHCGNKEYSFLNSETIRDFDELNELFFEVLAVKIEERSESVNKQFSNIPYLNSSLFERTSLENQTIRINSLKDRLELPVYRSTVLKDSFGSRICGTNPTLHYLFDFLDAFDFASESTATIQEQNKTLINASVLGLIFEKINGYKEGSFFTPGFITMYMCHETIRRATVQKFNEQFGWDLSEFSDLKDKINATDKAERKQANNLINSIKICDPAVGSGHFLVSALNEMIAVKSELGILEYRDGTRVRGYRISIENDELIITDEETENNFAYRLNQNNHPIAELQNLQETIFHEKQTIIENCLFGVDINPKSVMICRLRLWIELLKNAYYTDDSKYTELETLPNIDINIKCGNSLISRFPLDADLKLALKKSKWNIDSYRTAVETYRNASSKAEKREMEKLIDSIKNDFESEIARNDKRFLRLVKLKGDLTSLTTQTSLFEKSKKEKDDWNKQVNTITSEIQKLETELDEVKNNVIYRNAFEWRFEFPEVLDENGDFKGFDVVIGNPPYFSVSKLKDQTSYFETASYLSYLKGTDIYCLFYERGSQILKTEGFLTYITSNSWLRAIYGIPLKRYFSQYIQPVLLLNIEDIQIFEEATVESNIITLKKTSLLKSFYVANLNSSFKANSSLSEYFKANSYKYEIPESPEWIIGNEEIGLLKIKIEKDSKLLKNFNIEINRGILTGYNTAFIIDELTKNTIISEDPNSAKIIKPILRGRDLRKYSYEFNNIYLLNTHNGIKEKKIQRINVSEDFPVVYDYLLKFLPQVENRYDKGDHWSNLRNCAYLEDFDKPKIIWGEISDKPKFAYDDSKYFAEATTFIMTGENLKYLLAILNSKVSEWYFNQISTTTGMGTNRWKKYKIELLPIKDIPISSQLPLINLVDEIISIKQKDPDAHTHDLENQIDQLVYELYGLTEEEILIIEGSFES